MAEPTTADVMCRRVVTAARDTSFKELVGAMIVHEVSMIPVVDSTGRPVGMVTEEDLATKLARRRQSRTTCATTPAGLPAGAGSRHRSGTPPADGVVAE